MIDKYCGLFLTAGEKRLGHHFFRGFSFILDKLFKDDFAIKENFNFIDNFFLKKAFQQIKRVDSDEAFNENFD